MAAVKALDFLSLPKRYPPGGVCAVFGDDAFLKRCVITALRDLVCPGEDAEFATTVFEGSAIEPRDLFDELATVGLFGDGTRLVIVESADSFVSQHRPRLEGYVARPAKSSVLVLEIKAWPSNTRLYKSVDKSGQNFDCKVPDAKQLPKWLCRWAKARHSVQLSSAVADQIVEIVGPEPGRLDQEVAKLAAAVGGEAITPELAQELVGGWRAKTTWVMLDAALAGDVPTALAELDRLLVAGEHPVAVMAQIGSTLRRFAATTRIVEQTEASGRRANVRQALQQAGVRPFVLAKAEGQIRRLGRQRAGCMYRWLLDADRQLKGGSTLAPRMVLERLVVRMSAEMA